MIPSAGQGDESRSFVRTGNDLAELSSILYFVAFCLQIHVIIEQPLCSCLPLFASMKLALYYSSSRRYITYMGTLVVNSCILFLFLGILNILNQKQLPIADFQSQ